MVQDNENLMEKVQSIMKKLRNPIPVAKLRLHTDLSAFIRNETMWQSTCHMLRLYQNILQYLPEVEVEGLDGLLLLHRGNKRADAILDQLSAIESVKGTPII